MREQEKTDSEILHKKRKDFPWYINQFLEYKLRKQRSPSSMLEYLRDIEIFFSWLINTAKSDGTAFVDIQLCELEILEMQDFEQYKQYLTVERQLVLRSVQRKMSSLKSVFNYLHDIAQDESKRPLLTRNITRKLTSKRLTTPEGSAREIHDKILMDQHISDFLRYIEHTYPEEHGFNKQAMYCFEFNHIRDMCIIAMQLLAGLRVSDVVDLNMEDVNLKARQIVLQRGNHFTNVFFGETLLKYIDRYLMIREAIYKPEKNEPAFFLSQPNGHAIGKRITKRGIQEMIKKYGKAYGKSELTARQLRHSFSLDHSKKTDLLTTKDHLMQTLESTEKYGYLARLLGI